MSAPTPVEQQFQQYLQQQQQQHQQQMHTMQQEVLALRQQVQAVSSNSSSSSGSSSSSSSLVKVKPNQPSVFYGRVESNAEQWVVEVERYFSAAGISENDSRRVLLASTYLKEGASIWYTSVVSSNELSNNATWNEFKVLFLRRFRPLAASRIARAKIRLLKHHRRVVGYAEEFQKLMQQIPDMSVADQIEFFSGGLQRHIAVEVDREQPKSLHEAMEIATRVELIMNGRNAYGGSAAVGKGYYGGSGGSSGKSSGSAPMDLSAVEGDCDFVYADEVGSAGHPLNLLATAAGSNATTGKMNSNHIQEVAAATATAVVNAMNYRGGLSSWRGGQRRPFRGGGRGGQGGRGVPGLSKDEYDRLSKEGKCFRCKEGGHLARNCPKKSLN